MRRHRQSVTMIVATNPTSTRSWTKASGWIGSPPRRKSGVRLAQRAPPFVVSRIDARCLGQVVPDVAEDVLDLPAEEDHRDDHGDGDDRNDEGVFDQALTVVLAEETLDVHRVPLSSSAQSRRLPGRRP